jgi:hypothetical protein
MWIGTILYPKDEVDFHKRIKIYPNFVTFNMQIIIM